MSKQNIAPATLVDDLEQALKRISAHADILENAALNPEIQLDNDSVYHVVRTINDNTGECLGYLDKLSKQIAEGGGGALTTSKHAQGQGRPRDLSKMKGAGT